jgi:aldehyde dehydrogenase (NAD+)
MEFVAEKRDTDQIDRIFQIQRKRSLEFRQEAISIRKDRLKRLSSWLYANRERVKQAVHQDFSKPLLEVDTSELYPVIAEIRHVLNHLDDWARPVKIDATLSYLGTRSEIRYEPKGVCLIIAPWNFPFNLCIGPLISCLAAGNTAILKPSELTPATSKLLSEMIPEIFSEEEVAVIEGGIETASHLISLPFDHIFFTGSPAVGKIVMKAAAENLTSVTLELGGKSPTIVDATANLKDAAKRIAFGKFMNNGQTCIAPDYVLVEEKIRNKFLEELRREVIALFGENNTITESSSSYARIVNSKNFQRINHLVQDAVERGAKLEVSGAVNEKTRFIHPIVLSEVPLDCAIMENEIFGPVLPVISYSSTEEITNLINSKPKPLALYIFSNKKSFREQILNQTSAGGVCINDCVIQFTHPNLPFGGVNNSGIGKSHGRYGFLAFSNEKPILRQKNGFASPYMLYPPYLPKMKKIVDLLLHWF